MIYLRSRRQGQQSATGLVLARSVIMMLGIASSFWRGMPKKKKKERLAHHVLALHSDRAIPERFHTTERHAQVQWLCKDRGLVDRLHDRSPHCGRQSAS